MDSFPDHYAALGIDPTADQEVIQAAYRALAKKYHPDTGATLGTASPERFAAIQQAYEVLGTPESRRHYDLELLEATKRELEAHLAKRRRRLEARAGIPAEDIPQPGPSPGGPDLGGIRPEPRGARHVPPVNPGETPPRRAMGPFLVLGLLVLGIVGGLSWAALRDPGGPPLEEPKLAAPATPPKEDAQPVKPPLFGSSVTDPIPEPRSLEKRAAEAQPALEDAPPAEPATPAPVPKARPVTAAKPAPAPPKPQQPKPAQRQASRGAPFTLVIFYEDADGEVLTDRAGIAFSSESRCEQLGAESVDRRRALSEDDPLPPRIWYECLSAAEMR